MPTFRTITVAFVLASLLTTNISTAQDKPALEIAGLGISKKDPKSQFGQGLSPMRSPGLEVDICFQLTYSRTWQIASDAKAVKVKVSYYASSEAIKVPCKLEFGLGL